MNKPRRIEEYLRKGVICRDLVGWDIDLFASVRDSPAP
jgi:hypothetical protein